MSFAVNFPDRSIITALGDDVAYTSGTSTPVDLKAIVNFNVDQSVYNGELLCEMEFLKEDVPSITRGDTVNYLSKDYKIDTIVNDDGKFVRVGVIG